VVESRLIGPVRVVGAGLLGTSVALGLRARGIDVILADASPTHVAIAVDLGAGRRAEPEDAPQLIVVAVPPDVTASVVAAELAAFPEAIVTDVASVKAGILDELVAAGADVSRGSAADLWPRAPTSSRAAPGWSPRTTRSATGARARSTTSSSTSARPSWR